MRQALSPQQLVDYLSRHTGLSLHHETMYQHIYANKSMSGDLLTHLRVASKPYRKRYGHYYRRGKIKNRVSIDERPVAVDRFDHIGDWQGDTIIRKGHQGARLTMSERKTRYTLIVLLKGKHTHELAQAAAKAMELFS